MLPELTSQAQDRRHASRPTPDTLCPEQMPHRKHHAFLARLQAPREPHHVHQPRQEATLAWPIPRRRRSAQSGNLHPVLEVRPAPPLRQDPMLIQREPHPTPSVLQERLLIRQDRTRAPQHLQGHMQQAPVQHPKPSARQARSPQAREAHHVHQPRQAPMSVQRAPRRPHFVRQAHTSHLQARHIAPLPTPEAM